MSSFNLAVRRFVPAAWAAIIAIGISFLTRVALLIGSAGKIDAGALSMAHSFLVGMIFDIVTAGFILIPLVLHISFTNNLVYSKKGKWLAIAVFTTCLFILLFTQLIPEDFNKNLYKAVIG